MSPIKPPGYLDFSNVKIPPTVNCIQVVNYTPTTIINYISPTFNYIPAPVANHTLPEAPEANGTSARIANMSIRSILNSNDPSPYIPAPVANHTLPEAPEANGTSARIANMSIKSIVNPDDTSPKTVPPKVAPAASPEIKVVSYKESFQYARRRKIKHSPTFLTRLSVLQLKSPISKRNKDEIPGCSSFYIGLKKPIQE